MILTFPKCDGCGTAAEPTPDEPSYGPAELPPGWTALQVTLHGTVTEPDGQMETAIMAGAGALPSAMRKGIRAYAKGVARAMHTADRLPPFTVSLHLCSACWARPGAVLELCNAALEGAAAGGRIFHAG